MHVVGAAALAVPRARILDCFVCALRTQVLRVALAFAATRVPGLSCNEDGSRYQVYLYLYLYIVYPNIKKDFNKQCSPQGLESNYLKY